MVLSKRQQKIASRRVNRLSKRTTKLENKEQKVADRIDKRLGLGKPINALTKSQQRISDRRAFAETKLQESVLDNRSIAVKESVDLRSPAEIKKSQRQAKKASKKDKRLSKRADRKKSRILKRGGEVSESGTLLTKRQVKKAARVEKRNINKTVRDKRRQDRFDLKSSKASGGTGVTVQVVALSAVGLGALYVVSQGIK